MREVLTRPEEATLDWLNEVLGGAGGGGAIVGVRHGSAHPQAGASRVHALEVTYAPGTPAERCTRLLLKLSRADPNWAGWGGITGRQLMANEVCFYREIAPLMPEVPTIGCFDAAFDPQTGAGHLLLEDVSATHMQPPRPDPPPEPVCAQAVEVLAALHARWWERSDLDWLRELRGDTRASSTIDADVARVSGKVAAFLEYMGGALPAHRRTQLAAAAAFLPTLLRRQAAGPHTLIHQDAHWRNFLYPKDQADPGGLTAATRPTYLIDWQSWTVGACVRDLVYLLARHWGPTGGTGGTRGQHLLVRLLQRYHEGVAARGVGGYAWSQLEDDFRFAVTRTLCTTAVRWSDFGSPTDERERWAASVERSAIVFEALGCADLLG